MSTDLARVRPVGLGWPTIAGMDLPGGARAVVERQGGAATTTQLAGWGLSAAVVARKVTSGRWQRLQRGVVLLHSGPPAWRERAHGALLYAGAGAALSHSSAAYVHRISPAPGFLLEVSVPGDRFVRPAAGLVIHRRRSMPHAAGRLRAVNENATVVDLVARAAGDDAAVAVVGAAVLRGVLPDRVLAEAGSRERLANRSILTELLAPGAEAIESPLEHRYARDVERRHRLPRGRTQIRQLVGGRWIRADRLYVGLGVRIELDGQLAHPFATTDDDVWRDNAVVLSHSEITLRYRWSHVAATPCAAATQVAGALRARGWRGDLRPCSSACTAR